METQLLPIVYPSSSGIMRFGVPVLTPAQLFEAHCQFQILRYIEAGLDLPFTLFLLIWKDVVASFGTDSDAFCREYPSFARLIRKCSNNVIPNQKYCDSAPKSTTNSENLKTTSNQYSRNNVRRGENLSIPVLSTNLGSTTVSSPSASINSGSTAGSSPSATATSGMRWDFDTPMQYVPAANMLPSAQIYELGRILINIQSDLEKLSSELKNSYILPESKFVFAQSPHLAEQTKTQEMPSDLQTLQDQTSNILRKKARTLGPNSSRDKYTSAACNFPRVARVAVFSVRRTVKEEHRAAVNYVYNSSFDDSEILVALNGRLLSRKNMQSLAPTQCLDDDIISMLVATEKSKPRDSPIRWFLPTEFCQAVVDNNQNAADFVASNRMMPRYFYEPSRCVQMSCGSDSRPFCIMHTAIVKFVNFGSYLTGHR